MSSGRIEAEFNGRAWVAEVEFRKGGSGIDVRRERLVAETFDELLVKTHESYHRITGIEPTAVFAKREEPTAKVEELKQVQETELARAGSPAPKPAAPARGARAAAKR